MTVLKAFAALSKPLVFGNAEQIAAVAFISAVEKCIAATDACTHEKEQKCGRCKGTGQIDCECDCGHRHEAECSRCEGKGFQIIVLCDNCAWGFKEDVLDAAAEVVAHGWPAGARRTA